MWVFVNCLIENPAFDSQTKENMTLVQKNFGSTAKISEKFVTACSKSGIVESVQSWMKYKDQEKMNKASGNKKTSKLKGLKPIC